MKIYAHYHNNIFININDILSIITENVCGLKIFAVYRVQCLWSKWEVGSTIKSVYILCVVEIISPILRTPLLIFTVWMQVVTPLYLPSLSLPPPLCAPPLPFSPQEMISKHYHTDPATLQEKIYEFQELRHVSYCSSDLSVLPHLREPNVLITLLSQLYLTTVWWENLAIWRVLW